MATSLKHPRFTVEFDREIDGRWIAEVAALPGVMAYGSTKKEAQQNVYALALRVLADRVESGSTPASISLLFSHEMARR